MTKRNALAFALPAMALAVMATGCGGSDSAESPAATGATREAAAAADTRTCPPQTGYTYKATIANLLPTSIMLRASEYDCNDWDGDSTPGHAFTGQVIKPGEKRTFTLQPAKYTTRNWTMEILRPPGSTSLGRARMTMPQTSLDFDRIEVAGATREYVPRGQMASGVPDFCYFLSMTPTAAPDTPWSRIGWFTDVPLSVVARSGRVAIASQCGSGGATG
jgi:hypothetical protein